MASIEDRWFRPKRDPKTRKPVLDERGKSVLEQTDRHGKGLRWCVRWYEPDGRERRQSFAKKVDADAHKATVEADMLRGQYIDARAGKELFGDFATRWLADQTTDPVTRAETAARLRRYVEPFTLWRTQLGKVKPGTIQAWVRALDGAGRGGAGIAESTKLVVWSNVSAILNAAVADELIGKNPCNSPTVRKPKPDDRKVVAWPREWVVAMHAQMPDRYRVAVPLGSGVGLRQGEIFGLAVKDVDFLRGKVTVQRQVKVVDGQLVFALPKGRKSRDVPLPGSVRDELAAHLAEYPAVAVTLPWREPGGKPVTVDLVVPSEDGSACHRTTFNREVWRKTRAKAGVPQTRENGMHAMRHYYASVLLDAGENIKAVSEFLGHVSTVTTLEIYGHMMPSSEDRTKSAIDAAWCGPSTAPALRKGGVTS
ncbi:MAG TPA: site-specific integrase [Amycolatopsis sp.]|uniref:tyrosine-type recombinase/integrase n=1 Tax=Amycolatopsis sp. TaxID=37632 RepID=UPI002B48943A|nr:site-specific integrase [Amycolatopsis sp.]HKS46226.1 site-specific integrase [Amycolatopsis sp.]